MPMNATVCNSGRGARIRANVLQVLHAAAARQRVEDLGVFCFSGKSQAKSTSWTHSKKRSVSLKDLKPSADHSWHASTITSTRPASDSAAAADLCNMPLRTTMVVSSFLAVQEPTARCTCPMYILDDGQHMGSPMTARSDDARTMLNSVSTRARQAGPEQIREEGELK